MAKRVAIDFDNSKVRLAVGQVSGGKLRVNQFDELMIPPLSDEAENLYDRIAITLKEYVVKNGLSKSEAIVSANRAMIEMRVVHLPPAGDEELPDMVRFAAQRSFSQLGENWPLDFVKLGSDDEGVYVLAAAINSIDLARSRALCESVGLTFQKISVRSIVSALFMIDHSKDASLKDALIVIPNGEEFDLTVTSRGNVAVTRTTKIPAGKTSRLLGEVKRTLVAAGSQTPPVNPARVVCIRSSDLESLKQLDESGTIELKSISTDTMLTDSSVPFDEVHSQFGLATLLSEKAIDDPRSIDFLNPKKRPEPKSQFGRVALLGGAIATLLVIGLVWYYMRASSLDAEITRLTQESNSKDDTVELAEEFTQKWGVVEQFEAGNIQLLDELVFVSENSLPAEQMVFGELNFNLQATDGYGKIVMPASFVAADARRNFDSSLTDERHVTTSKKFSSSKGTNTAYVYLSDPVIRINSNDSATILKRITSPPPATTAPQSNAVEEKMESKLADGPNGDPPGEDNSREEDANMKGSVEEPAVESAEMADTQEEVQR